MLFYDIYKILISYISLHMIGINKIEHNSIDIQTRYNIDKYSSYYFRSTVVVYYIVNTTITVRYLQRINNRGYGNCTY